MPQARCNALPPEVWHQVISYLSKIDICLCRLISHKFNDMAVNEALAELSITIGSRARHGEPAASEFQSAQEQVARTSSLIDRITHDPTFASFVRRLVVHFYGWRQHQMEILVDALCSLHRLQSFTWFGARLVPSDNILHALERGCPSLRVLSLPLQTYQNRKLSHSILSRLRSISVTPPEFGTTIRTTLTSLSCNTSLESLCFLRMFYSRPADIPLAHLPNLLELEVAFTDTYDGLGEAVRQAPQLQSLCLFWITHEVDEVIHEVVAAISHLPNLAMLAIQHGTTYTPIPAAACAQFCAALRGRARLRRLFCNLRIRHDDCAAHLDMLATLPNLEILALVTEDVLCVEFLAELQRCLPAQLSVLMLSHTYADSHGPQAFLRFWQHFSNLSFLRVEAWAAPGLTAHDIVHHAGKSLQLVQYRGDVLDVEHWEDGQTMLWPWSTQKILLRGIEDSGCEGWNWYMRHSLA